MPQPSFAAKSELTRQVDEVQRARGNRPAPDVFVANPGDSHLSVHSLEMAPLSEILDIYSKRQDHRPVVTYCVKQVLEYNLAAKNTAGAVTKNAITGAWEFSQNGRPKPAYLHRGAYEDDPHCGVEYVRVLDEHALQVARRLAQKKYHEHRPSTGQSRQRGKRKAS